MQYARSKQRNKNSLHFDLARDSKAVTMVCKPWFMPLHYYLHRLRQLWVIQQIIAQSQFNVTGKDNYCLKGKETF